MTTNFHITAKAKRILCEPIVWVLLFFFVFFSFRFDSGPKQCVALLCIHCAYPSPGLPPVLKWETAQNNISAAWLTVIRCVMLQFKCSKQGKCIKLQSKMDFCACGAIPPLLLVIG